MKPAPKRAKSTEPSTGEASAHSADASFFIPFQTGPTLERIPEDVLYEILSHLPALNDRHVHSSYFIPTASLIRTPTLRALSQASRLLRSRCLARAWQSVELCGVTGGQRTYMNPDTRANAYKQIGEATEMAIRVFNACPHLLPLIRTVTVVLTRYRYAEIIPAFAECLAKLSNLTTIQVTRVACKMTPVLKKGFKGKQFPSVRKISLHYEAHNIIQSCPNLEEVTCLSGGDNDKIMSSLVKGNCRHVHTLKGIYEPFLPRTKRSSVKLLPNLKYIQIMKTGSLQVCQSFPLLDTIEIVFDHFFFGCGETLGRDQLLSEEVAPEVHEAYKILKENKSMAEKTVIMTIQNSVLDNGRYDFDLDIPTIREVIKV